MKRLRRWLAAAWLGAALNALSPVLAYAHSVVLPGALFHEHSAGDFAGSEHAHHHHPGGSVPGEKSKHSDAPHCPYCPGYAAGVALAQFAIAITVEAEHAAPRQVSLASDPDCRSFVRIALPRAPPPIS
jgi:Protein of unknown function (DUF2946)